MKQVNRMSGQQERSPYPVFINGRFCSQALTGVQRYSQELVCAIDGLLGTCETIAKQTQWTLMVPRGAVASFNLRHIRIKSVGRTTGHLWDQTELAWASRSGVLLSFANSGPVLHRKHLVVLHDALVYRYPDNFSFLYRLFHQNLGRLLARSASIATVSEFSRRELAKILNLKPGSIAVVPNGSDHFRGKAADKTILDRLSLNSGQYFLCIGATTKTKNIGMVISTFLSLPTSDLRLVVVGSAPSSVFSQPEAPSEDKNIILAGRLNDAEIVALYQSAAGLIYPSLYEGFGIPPLEAMSNSCPVLASSAAEAVREVCGDAALLFDPGDRHSLKLAMDSVLQNDVERSRLLKNGGERVKQFTWKDSAKRILSEVHNLVP